jgi:hypothetical protein
MVMPNCDAREQKTGNRDNRKSQQAGAHNYPHCDDSEGREFQHRTNVVAAIRSDPASIGHAVDSIVLLMVF